MSNLIEKFRFIKDDVFLCPCVDTETGRQRLLMQKLDERTGRVQFENSIDCIHVAVTDISVEEFENYQNYGGNRSSLGNKSLYIRSSEGLQEIHLKPLEKFKAFKSWVAGIAEAGLDAFKIQGDIEKAANLQYPIENALMKFMVRAYPEFIYDFLMKIERDCIFEGKKHESSLISNLIPLLRVVSMKCSSSKILNSEDREIIKYIFELCPSKNLFAHEPRFFKLILNTYSYNFKELCEKFDLFNIKEYGLRRVIASNPDATDFAEYANLFKDGRREIRSIVAANPQALEYKEYLDLFQDRSKLVRKAVADNYKAAELPNFKNLFSDWDFGIRCSVASNINAPRFEEYKALFNDHRIQIKISIAGNQNATKFEEYSKYFKDEDWRIRAQVAKNPNAIGNCLYKELFFDNHHRVRCALASNPEASKLEFFSKLFEDSNVMVRLQASKNKEAIKHKEFAKLFKDNSFRVKRFAKSKLKEYDNIWNPKLENNLKFKSLFDDNSVIKLDSKCLKKKRIYKKKSANLNSFLDDPKQQKITQFV